MTHSQLVRAALKWLRLSACYACEETGHKRTVRCGVVLSELSCSAYEIPDAIGWFFGGRFSVLIECKTSRSDFRADAKKSFRSKPHTGVGRYRYFLAPEGIIPPADVPERWGLLEVDGRTRIRVVRLAEQVKRYNVMSEVALLWSALRRVQNTESVALVGKLLETFGTDAEEHY